MQIEIETIENGRRVTIDTLNADIIFIAQINEVASLWPTYKIHLHTLNTHLTHEYRDKQLKIIYR